MSPNYARKIITEIEEHGRIIPVEDLKVERSDERVKGVGSKVLTLEEQMFLLELRNLDSTRTRDNYVINLFQFCGKHVSKTFISDFFLKIGPFKGSFRAIPQVVLSMCSR